MPNNSGTRGGGAGRFPPAEARARYVQRVYRADFERARRDAERELERHLNATYPHGGGGGTRGGGAGRDTTNKNRQHLHEILSAIFANMKAWAQTSRRVADAVYRANVAAVRAINDALAAALADGASREAYILRTPDYYSLPYTEAVVAALVKEDYLSLHPRRVDRKKDTNWTSQRLQSILTAAVLEGTPVDKLPRVVAQRLIHSAQDAMDTTAMASIYGAFDTGVYEAGMDAIRAGLRVEKIWLSIMDSRVRDSHRHLNNTTLAMKLRFHGLHGTLRYPHDPAAPPAETRRCRCRMAIHLPGHAPRAPESLTPAQVSAYIKWRDQTIDELGAKALIQRHLVERR